AAGNGRSFLCAARLFCAPIRGKPEIRLPLDSRSRPSNDLFIISRWFTAGGANSGVRALTMADRSQSESALVQFSERLTNSAAFGTLFRVVMDLVAETAAYLDGVGRNEARALERSVSLTY